MESGVEQEQSFGQLLEKLPSGQMQKSRKGISGVKKTFMVQKLSLSLSLLNLKEEKTNTFSKILVLTT